MNISVSRETIHVCTTTPEKQCNVSPEYSLAVASLTKGVDEECNEYERKVCTTTYDEKEILENCNDAIQGRCKTDDENCKLFVKTVKKILHFYCLK